MIWDKLEDWHSVAPYVDTLLIPVIDVNVTDKAKLNEGWPDTLNAAGEIERQLTGRVILMPPIPFIANDEWMQALVNDIRSRVESGEFTYLFFLMDEDLRRRTPDVDWGTCLTFSDMPSSPTRTTEQIRQLCEQIIQKWQKAV